jgi:steroid delta-isomerase-like uncharacterized protein
MAAQSMAPQGENLLQKNADSFEGLTPQERDNLKVVMEELNGWDTQDVERVISVMAPDGIYQDMTQPPAHGHDEIREFGRKWVSGAPDFRVHVEQFVVQDDTVVNRGVISGTIKGEFWGLPATNKRFDLPYCQVAKVRNGKIVRIWDFSDSATLAYQVGWQEKPAYE